MAMETASSRLNAAAGAAKPMPQASAAALAHPMLQFFRATKDPRTESDELDSDYLRKAILAKNKPRVIMRRARMTALYIIIRAT